MLRIKGPIFSLFLLFLAISHLGAANEDLFYDHIEEAISCSDETRIFIKPEKILFSQGQIYIRSGADHLVSPPMICFSDSSIFVPKIRFLKRKTFPVWLCRNPYCSRRHTSRPSYCSGCGGTSFIIHYYPQR